MRKMRLYLFYTIAFLLLTNCSNRFPISEDAASKITFSLDEIDENGMLGDEDSKRMVAYIFRIEANANMKRQIHRIDPSIRFFLRKDEYQCIGGGATKERLLRLASLPYIKKIEPFYGE
jgi:hypothetical protein